MKKIIERISEASDIDALKNVAKLLCEHIECEPCSGRKMETMKEIATELEQYSYDEEMANMHLCLIGELHTAIDADLMWKAENGLTRYDWRVLWGADGTHTHRQNKIMVHRYIGRRTQEEDIRRVHHIPKPRTQTLDGY